MATDIADILERAAVPPDEIVWMRDLDETGSMHVCTPHCPNAIPYIRCDLVYAAAIEMPCEEAATKARSLLVEKGR